MIFSLFIQKPITHDWFGKMPTKCF